MSGSERGDTVPEHRVLDGEGYDAWLPACLPNCLLWARLVNGGPSAGRIQRGGWQGDGGGKWLAACHRHVRSESWRYHTLRIDTHAAWATGNTRL